MDELQPGVYQHYKGDRYTVLFVGKHHDSRAEMVIYLSHKTGGINVRPLRATPDDPDGWLEEVNLNKGLVDGRGTPIDSEWVPRFVKV
jgi:hypothetical protein